MSKRKTPEIRFKGFDEDWEQRKLENTTLKIGSGKTPKGGSTVYAESGIPLLRSQNIHSNKVNFNDVVYITEDINKQMLNSSVLKDDVLLNITGASIGRSAVYTADTPANVNQHVCIIRPNQEGNSFFIQLNIVSTKGQKEIELNQAGGGREGLNFQQISKMTFSYPSIEEQLQIGSFFKQLDDTIALHQDKLEKLKQLKKGYLQLMFPQKGEKVPRLRFAHFSSDWEQRKLGETSQMYQPVTITSEKLIDSGIPVFGANGYIGFFNEANHYKNQVTISARGEGTGTPNYVKGPVWITGNSMVVNIEKTNIDKYFLYSELLVISLKKYVTGGAQPQLTRDVLNTVPVKIPEHNEQAKIGSSFKLLDDSITLHKSKVLVLQELKKVYLQKLFV